MKYKAEIKSLFGDSFTHDLRGLIEKGAIEKETIKRLADDMGVSTAYTANKDKDPFNGVDTMELYKLIRAISRSFSPWPGPPAVLDQGEGLSVLQLVATRERRSIQNKMKDLFVKIF